MKISSGSSLSVVPGVPGVPASLDLIISAMNLVRCDAPVPSAALGYWIHETHGPSLIAWIRSCFNKTLLTKAAIGRVNL